jgi:hypothetical protein
MLDNRFRIHGWIAHREDAWLDTLASQVFKAGDDTLIRPSAAEVLPRSIVYVPGAINADSDSDSVALEQLSPFAVNEHRICSYS